MPRGNDRNANKRAPRTKEFTRRGGRKKVCVYCTERLFVDYKDVNILRRFQSDRGKIKARRVTGNCTQHHRDVAIAIKTARELALLPYLQRTVVERAGGRSLRVGGSGDRGPRSGPPRSEADVGDGAGGSTVTPEALAVGVDALDPDLLEPDVLESDLMESEGVVSDAADVADDEPVVPEPVQP